jgi:curved DNA-binding protein CbpA
MRDRLIEYYSLLGVKPGSSPDEIKKAFRDRIKIHHPDRSPEEAETARLLIEAYQAVKDAPSLPEPKKPSVPRSAHAASPTPSAYDAGRVAGRRIFEGVFGGGRSESDDPLKRVFHSFEKGSPEPRRTSGPKSPGEEHLERAESLLREVVGRYNRQTHRPRRHWARDYIGHLGKVQILYRDVMKRYPHLYVAANRRLTQIKELIAEIRNMV